MTKYYRVKFEAYVEETNVNIYTVEILNSHLAAIKVDSTVNIKSWNEIAVEVRNFLIAMGLEK